MAFLLDTNVAIYFCDGDPIVTQRVDLEGGVYREPARLFVEHGSTPC